MPTHSGYGVRMIFKTLLFALVVPGLAASAEEQLIEVPGGWNSVKELAGHDGFAWYRVAVNVPESWNGEPLQLDLGRIDDADETFFNGTRIGGMGGLRAGGGTAWNQERTYAVPAELVKPGEWNRISVRVLDTGGNGGIWSGRQVLSCSRGAMSLAGTWFIETGDEPGEETAAALGPRLFKAAQENNLPLVGGTAIGWTTPSTEPPQMEPNLLWYEQPAREWIEALPIGNGRLGGMVYGDWKGSIQLNEDSLWAGEAQDRVRNPPDGALEKARELWFDGKVTEAQAIMQESFMSPRLTRSHQTLGMVETHAIDPTSMLSEYRRGLDLNTGFAVSKFQANGVSYRFASFASREDDVIVVRWDCDALDGLIPAIRLWREGGAETSASWDSESAIPRITIQGQAVNGDQAGVRYASTVMVWPEGRDLDSTWEMTEQADEALTLEGKPCKAYTVVIAGATSFNGEDAAALSIRKAEQAISKGFLPLVHAQLEEWQNMPPSTELKLASTEQAAKPTDVRLRELREGANDPGLFALYLRYAWYLMVSSSQPGTMPANLQGLWNEHIEAPWNADYHININLQMNYWPAEPMGLSDHHQPLFDFVECLAERGEDTAQRLYGAGGWVAHHTSDAWCFTVPIGRTVWGMWPHGGAWMLRHMWEHYLFGGDEVFLRERAWPLLKGHARFYLDYLVEDPATGKLVSGPSSSPENTFITDDGQRADIGMGNAMDQQIVWDLFTMTLQAAEVLGEDDELTAEVRVARDQLAPTMIGEDGRLMEWSRPFREAEPGHRHISHLYALHPGSQFTIDNDPAFVEAARKSLEFRLANGGGHTGWSRAWLINFFARLHDGEAAYDNLRALLTKSTYPNLFDAHPPFQIDGNFGGAAGIIEMMVQSHARPAGSTAAPGTGFLIDLLPALPPAWTEGFIGPIRCRGGVEVTLAWGADACSVQVRMIRGGQLNLRVPEGWIFSDNGERTISAARDAGWRGRYTFQRKGQ